MTYIQPLELQTWFMSVFSGTPEIFVALSLMVITALAAYFRMGGVSLFFMVTIFLLMFSGFFTSPLTAFVSIIGSILIGFALARILAER